MYAVKCFVSIEIFVQLFFFKIYMLLCIYVRETKSKQGAFYLEQKLIIFLSACGNTL